MWSEKCHYNSQFEVQSEGGSIANIAYKSSILPRIECAKQHSQMDVKQENTHIALL